MTAEVKIRTLAQQNSTLLAALGSSPFRWFDDRMPQTQLASGTCVRVTRIGTGLDYSQGGIMNLTQPHFQIDVLDYNPETARSLAQDIIDFMESIDLTSAGQLASPYSTPTHAPNFLTNRRQGMLPKLEPPVYVETLEYRVYNREDLP